MASCVRMRRQVAKNITSKLCEKDVYIYRERRSAVKGRLGWFAAAVGGFLFALPVSSQLADMKEPWQSSQPAASTPEE